MVAATPKSKTPYLKFAEGMPTCLAGDGDDLDWAKRSETWFERYTQQRKGTRKRGCREPLIVAGHGASLRIEHGALLVRDGFTHHPQEQQTCRFFKGDPAVPSRILLLDVTGTLSFEVLAWLQEQDVTLVQLDWKGNVVCVASRSGYAANPHHVMWQHETRANEERRLAFASEIIAEKIENSLDVLRRVLPQCDERTFAIAKADAALDVLVQRKYRSMKDIRGIEANAAAAYFRPWREVSIKWRGTERRRVPDSWLRYERRQSGHSMTGNRNAHHPINALLNYAYTILQSQVQISAIGEGYDPAIGLMHEPKPGSQAFILDIMEPHRPRVDAIVLHFVEQYMFHAADFVIRPDGVCRLNPQLARRMASAVTQDL